MNLATTAVANIDDYPQLNLPPCDLTLREAGSHIEVWDVVRRRWVALTPEEWVRQHVVHALEHSMGYPREMMQVEGSITLNQMTRRCDILVYGANTSPKMIVECKKPQVKLTQKVVDQACRYNIVLDVPFLYLTNGLNHLILSVDKEGERLVLIKNIPTWGELNS